HLAEFYPFYFSAERIERFAGHMRVAESGRPSFGRRECPEIIETWARGSEPVEDLHLLTTEHSHELLWSAFTGEAYTRVLNVINTDGLIEGIARDACIEAQVTVRGHSVSAQPLRLPPAVHSLVERWTCIHDLSIKAAVDCDRDAARQALFLDPHIKDPRDIDPMLDDFIAVLEPWLGTGWK
ncbi:MAG: hypothetical protein HRU15_07095, partial [Planctomycetes bacterium]|nr:hypothetical protein [Planctomycetota bacterium]